MREAVILRDVTLKTIPKDKIVVIGKIGTGKTTLLNSIMGEVERIKG